MYRHVSKPRKITAGGRRVLTVGSDQPVLTAAWVAQALAFTVADFCGYRIDRATNKRAMKAAFVLLYRVPNAPFACVCTAGRWRGQRFAGAAKAAGHLSRWTHRGSAVCSKCRLAEQAMARLDRLGETLSFSREDTALVERFYPSDEVTYSGFVLDGRVYPLTLTDRQLIEDPLHIGICSAHRYPSVLCGAYGRDSHDRANGCAGAWRYAGAAVYPAAGGRARRDCERGVSPDRRRV